MTGNLTSSGFAEFDRLTELFVRTRTVLERLLRSGELPTEASEFLATVTLPHVEAVEAGFRSSLRATESDLAELRALVRGAGRALAAPDDAAEQRAALEETSAERLLERRRSVSPAPSQELLAIVHARLVFAFLPRLPETEVHWPLGRRAYWDIGPPRRPSELAERIEEIEREVWWTAVGRPSSPFSGAYRRTFGFFDTAAWLGSRLTGGFA